MVERREAGRFVRNPSGFPPHASASEVRTIHQDHLRRPSQWRRDPGPDAVSGQA